MISTPECILPFRVPRSASLAAVLFVLLALASPASAAWIWVEGEKPAESTMNRHPWWYDQVKTEQLSGGDFISNFDEDKTGRGRVPRSRRRRPASTSSGSARIRCRRSCPTSSTAGRGRPSIWTRTSAGSIEHRRRRQARPAVPRLDQGRQGDAASRARTPFASAWTARTTITAISTASC